MISIDNITVEFGSFTLFKEVSFIINNKDRIGLVGKNGAGKSTLLKLINKIQAPSKGTISYKGDITIGYLPQHMIHADGNTVMQEAVSTFDKVLTLEKEIEKINTDLAQREDYESEAYSKLIEELNIKNDLYNMMGGTNFHSDIEKTLMGLGFVRSDFERQTSEFSGGWRMRIELAKILLKQPDVLLLDEPTNHLDIESIQWLEDFLKVYNGSVVLISHDKAFLDNVTNRTIEISVGKIYDYKVNYSKYVGLHAERIEQQRKAYENQQKMIKETEDFIERFRYKATKANQVQSRVKQLEKLDIIEIDEVDNTKLNLKFPPAPHSGNIVMEVKDLHKSYDELKVLNNVNFVIEKGEKIAFVGKNGEGKTTLVRIIMNELEYQGVFKLGHNVKIGYFAQNQAQLLDEKLSVFETIDNIAVGDIRTQIRNILGSFMFGGEDIEKKVKVLSGGERSRLAMIQLLLKPVNLLVLDEPTNHLDIKSKEVLKEAIKNFNGTAIIVSHDREFLDGLVDKVFEFKDKRVKDHMGGIYDFLQTKKLESLTSLNTSVNTKKEVLIKQKSISDGKLSYEERKELNKKIKKAENNIKKSEENIANLEEKIEESNQLLAKPENISDDSLYKKYEELKKELEQEMENWENFNEEFETLIQQRD